MSKRDILSAGGSVRQSVKRRTGIDDFRPDLEVQGLYIDEDTQKRLMGLIERLFEQRINIERDESIDLPLTQIELSILDIVASGRHTSRAALLREALHNMASKYFHKYRGMNND
jgi:hypothetical protein